MWLLKVQRLAAIVGHILFAIGLFVFGASAGPTSNSSQEPTLPSESELSRKPALVVDWANRALSNDPTLRATTEATIVQGAGRSLPLLRRFLNSRSEDLHLAAFEIIRRIGQGVSIDVTRVTPGQAVII